MKIIRNLFAFILTIHCCASTGQTFYGLNQRKEIEDLSRNGIVYINTGNDAKDSMYYTALDNEWSATPFRIFDPRDSEEVLLTQDIILFESSIGKEDILCLVKLGDLMSDNISAHAAIGYFFFNGFNQKSDSLSRYMFLQQTIAGMNDIVGTIISQKITGKNSLNFYNKVSAAIGPRSRALQGKTLLIIDTTKAYVNFECLDKNGIKYKTVSCAEFQQIMTDDPNSYCLLYFADNSFTETSIFNLRNNELIYTNFVQGPKRFDERDVGRIAQYME